MNHTEETAIDDIDFLDYAETHGFGDLHMKIDPTTGMRAIIAVHSTTLGPALGGCRFVEYPSTNTALYDAMRLARGMSYKAASVGLPLGGGKSVILKPQGDYDREAYFHAFGKFVNSLGGRYITALDSGTELTDMDIIEQHTSYIASCTRLHGDPSPSTAQGILLGIQAAAEFKWNTRSLKGRHVAIQGLGHVGYDLARHLHALGATLTVADIDTQRVEQAVNELGATSASVDAIHTVTCDIFAPCALGAVFNDETIPSLNTTVIAGGANNQLAHTYHGQQLHDRGILYAPDYVINAGGLIFAAHQYLKLEEKSLSEQLQNIHASLLEIFHRSARENIPTSTIADTIAQEKLNKTSS